jgi:hypothetical protein
VGFNDRRPTIDLLAQGLVSVLAEYVPMTKFFPLASKRQAERRNFHADAARLMWDR